MIKWFLEIYCCLIIIVYFKKKKLMMIVFFMVDFYINILLYGFLYDFF